MRRVLDGKEEGLFINFFSDEGSGSGAGRTKEKAIFPPGAAAASRFAPADLFKFTIVIPATMRSPAKAGGLNFLHHAPMPLPAPATRARFSIHRRRRNPEGKASSSANARRNICRR